MQDEGSQQPMNLLIVAQYSDAPHVTGFAIKRMSKHCLYRFLQPIHQPGLPSTQPHVASEAS
jgi:hypothetical protein